jgi:hypothetical protein
MLEAGGSEELLLRLANIDISVPARSEGRTSEHTEQYSICRFLSTVSKTHHVSYPLTIKKRERPDFLLCCNIKNIGIEVTEATSQDYSEYLAVAERDPTVTFVEPANFPYGKPVSRCKKTNS